MSGASSRRGCLGTSIVSCVGAVKRRGLVAMCTPFDEASVDKIVDMNFDVIKIASCSANDWPLLEKAASAGMPMIVSTGGLTLDQVDDVVSLLEHRGSDFALMHCVSIYPTPDEACNLGNIASFRARYPGRVIGWSTHENPADTVPIGVAAALGAEMFERHVGVATDTVKLNAYSATPEQIDDWIAAWKKVRTLRGSEVRQAALPEEREAIDGLRRGVFARGPIEANATLMRDDVYFAFPLAPGGLSSGEWRPGIVTLDEIAADAPVIKASIEIPGDPDEKIIKDAVHEVKALVEPGARAADHRVHGRVLASLRRPKFPPGRRRADQRHQPRLLQESVGSASRPDSSLALSQAQGGDLPHTLRNAACGGRGPAQVAPAGRYIARPARRVAPLLVRAGLRLRGDINDAFRQQLCLSRRRDQQSHHGAAQDCCRPLGPFSD